MIVRRALLALSVIALAACGGSAPDASNPVSPPAGQGVVVVTLPAQADVEPGATVRFGAQVTGTALTDVTWTVQEADGGTVDATGLYTAPSIEGTFHVRATSAATLKSNGTSAVRVKRKAGAIAVAVDPATATVAAGGTRTFAAAVTGTTNLAVDWSVQEGSSCGAVTAGGVYTAPGAAGTCHVVATSQADRTRSASAAVTVTAPPPVIAVAISPSSPTVQAGGTLAFTATVTGTAAGQSTAVTWSVPAGCGSIGASSGVYVAPSAAATCVVTATSVADASRTATVSVAVTAAPPPVAIAISPSTATLDACKGQVFTATVTNASSSAVTWRVVEAGGGTVTNGIYTAPQAVGTFHVTATSVADPTRTAQATVTVGPEKVLSVAVSPGSGTVQANGAVGFTAKVTTTCGTF